MKLEKLHIKNYKSIVDLEIVNPNPFTVFAGTNGSGKSNIFEALEFFTSSIVYTDFSTRLEPARLNDVSTIEINSDLITLIENEFGGREKFISRSSASREVDFKFNHHGSITSSLFIDYRKESPYFLANLPKNPFSDNLKIYRQFYYSFSRIFINNYSLDRLEVFKSKNISDRLFTSAKNLENVLRRLLSNEVIREDITEYLEIFVPGFRRIEIRSSDFELLVYENDYEEPFTKDLVSDGTYNILCLLTALFQSDEPQFLCIEEPENGLNPYVIQDFVELCRLMCEDYGHYIWLNTHSQTLVRSLKEEELILVDKKNRATQIKSFHKNDFHGLKADEAWLTNAVGAGIP